MENCQHCWKLYPLLYLFIRTKAHSATANCPSLRGSLASASWERLSFQECTWGVLCWGLLLGWGAGRAICVLWFFSSMKTLPGPTCSPPTHLKESKSHHWNFTLVTCIYTGIGGKRALPCVCAWVRAGGPSHSLLSPRVAWMFDYIFKH